MKSWVSEDWDNHFVNPAILGSTGNTTKGLKEISFEIKGS